MADCALRWGLLQPPAWHMLGEHADQPVLPAQVSLSVHGKVSADRFP